ncbi:DNA cytosine methyltransferase [Mycolicibacterium sp. XJ775]
MRIGSLFSGAGGLDMAVEQVFGGRTVWHCELDEAASKVLAHRWPGVPNLGDITAVDWSTVEPIDVLCGGFPCQDVSAAGRRAGIAAGTRSGLWLEFANIIDRLRPKAVVIENVRGLLSGYAYRAVESVNLAVGDGSGRPVLRAAGAVLGDLADLGYDAQWVTVSAASVGAPHLRNRVFVLAVDANAACDGRNKGWPESAGLVGGT